jgi:DnaJ-class molecular chaperone
MTKIHTHYDNLKITRNAPTSVVKAAYKALSQIYHPDKFKGCKKEAERITKIINASYLVLFDPVQRQSHDGWIDSKESEATEKEYSQIPDNHNTAKTEKLLPSIKALRQSYYSIAETDRMRNVRHKSHGLSVRV